MLDTKVVKDFGWVSPYVYPHQDLLRSISKVLENIHIMNSNFILDSGCGNGYVLNWLYLKGYSNILGIDSSESGINLAKKDYPSLQDKFYVHNCYDKILPGEMSKSAFDLILSIEVIEHLYSPQAYLENINSWLKKDGILLITTPYHGYLKNLLISLTNHFDNHFNPLYEVGHIKFFSKKTLYQLLDMTGFEPLEFYGSGRLSFLWKSMVIIARKA